MKILVDARSVGLRPSGVGMNLYSFMMAMRGIPGVELYAATDVDGSAEMERLRDHGVTVVMLAHHVRKDFSLLSYYRFLQKQIHEIRPDVFWEGNHLFPIRIENPYGRIAVTIYDMFPLTNPSWYHPLYPAYFRYGIRNTLKYTDRILYISEQTKQETEQFFPKAKEIPSNVAYVVVDPLPELPIKDDQFFFYIGNLEKRKGSDILIKAYLKYLEAGGDRDLILAGKIREADIETLLQEAMQKTNRIRYSGYVEYDERNRYYADCSAFVFPSRAEGFGMPVVEALSYRKPVIVSDIPIFREISGGLAECFHMSDDTEATVEALKKKLLETQFVLHKDTEVKAVTERYRPEILAKQVVSFFQEA